MSLTVRPFAPETSEAWDRFCGGAVNATLLHTRRFLSYHGARFEDASVEIVDDGEIVAVLPAARAPGDGRTVASHPGATYGGLVHQGWLTGSRTIEALEAIRAHYRNSGYDTLIYKALPHIYARVPAQDDLYALFRLGARHTRCDLASSIDLAARLEPSSRRKRGLKKAAARATLSAADDLLPAFFDILSANLMREHGARPVHSIDELVLLRDRFPAEILLRAALIDGRVEAGVVFFASARTWHAQYIAASEAAYDAAALDLLFASAIDEAQSVGMRYFDFGTSNEDGGRVLNEGLYRFKSEFGGGGVAHEFYELDLRP